MGRRRSGRFAQVVDDDSSGEVSQPKPPSGGASMESVQDQVQAKAKGMDGKAEEQRRQEPEARRRGRGRPPKSRRPEVAAAVPVELKQEEAPAAEPAPQPLFQISSLLSAPRSAEMERRRCQFAQADEAAWDKSPAGGASMEDVMENKKAALAPMDEAQTSRRGRSRPPKQRGKEVEQRKVLAQRQEAAPPAEPVGQQRRQEKVQAEESVEDAEAVRMDEDEEEPQTRRHGRSRPPKQLGQAAAEPVEKQRRRQEKAPVDESVEQQRHEEKGPAAEPVEQQQQEEAEVVELAMPIGDPVRISGMREKKPKKHYSSFRYNRRTFEVEDSVLITPEHEETEKPYVAIIKDITEYDDGNLKVKSRWFYRPEDAKIEDGGARDTRELFYSHHADYVPAESVMHKCVVHFIPQHKQIPTRKQHPGFFVQKVYGTAEKQLWNLKDEDYKKKWQKEIDLLVKKTKDRIGELPDLEPEGTPSDSTDRVSNMRSLQEKDAHPIDVTRKPPASKPVNIEKPETPASAQLKNYAILARYNAVTGEECRDKWLDKLLESIPLAWSKEIAARTARADPGASTKSSSNVPSTKIAGPQDNEKSYGLKDVVAITAALERSVYQALGTDFGKYNAKMRHLWYNIKHISKLRMRLMNKELDPPALLTMSPDELKVGRLTSAAKTSSEPKQSRQLQTTDARCLRCQEKKVRLSCSIHAGNRDCYQLECTSCGHTWSSFHDAVPSLTEGGPSTAAAAAGKAASARTTATAARGRRDGQQQYQYVRRKKSKPVLISGKTLKPIPEDKRSL